MNSFPIDNQVQPTSQSKSESQPSLNMPDSISRPTRPSSAMPFSEPDVHKYRTQGTPPGMILFAIFMAIFIIASGGGLIYWSSNHSSGTIQAPDQSQVSLTANALASFTATASANTTATAIANINPYISSASASFMDNSANTLVMDDPLSTNNQSSQWQENIQGTCRFINGSYHVSAAPNIFTTCLATGTNYTDFTYEIQMIFIQNAPKYSSGGIIFRSNAGQHKFYFFEVYASGRYAFQKCDQKGHCTILAGSPSDPPSPAYHVGQINTIAVVADQNTFTLYLNHQPVASPQTDTNSPYAQGTIGVLARGGLPPAPSTEVAYSNLRVWQMQ
jgi:hypothetical protein